MNLQTAVDVSGGTTYSGEAILGTATSSPGWSITKTVVE